MNKKILLVFAHPDDESFSSAGTIAKYHDLGWNIDLLCMTRGDAGERGEYEETVDVGAVRTEELESAAAVLGIQTVKFYPYLDGKLKEVNAGELEEMIYRELLVREPDVVITFEPNGVSNHPDHKKLCLSTTFAFQKYAKRRRFGERLGQRDPRRQFADRVGNQEERPEPRLYYACIPQSVVSFLIKNAVLPEESFGSPWVGIPDKKVTTAIDIRDYTEKKIQAIAKHKSQIADAERFLSIENQPLVYTEYFILRMEGKEEVFMGNHDHVSDTL